MLLESGHEVQIQFQFLDRNSVDLDRFTCPDSATHDLVSIPRSEFCGFRLLWMNDGTACIEKFQFLDRNSVDLDLCGCADDPSGIAFQFPDRNSVDLDWVGHRGWRTGQWSFNSLIGILWI